jgi:ribonuclease-3
LKYIFRKSNPLSKSIKNIFGFYPGNIFLYELAFRHKSKAAEIQKGVKNSNERLEYLGDAILDAIVADYLFKIFPYKDEGFLTKMRSKIVSRAMLNKISNKLGLYELVTATNDKHSQPKSMLGDAFEALVGAIYLDKGYDFAYRVCVEKVINLHLDIDELEHTETNFKSRLIEWSQKEKREVEFKPVKESGTGNNITHEVNLYVDKKFVCNGKDASIKKAEQRASEKAWDILNLGNSNNA